MLCVKCGRQAKGKFCSNCGSEVYQKPYKQENEEIGYKDELSQLAESSKPETSSITYRDKHYETNIDRWKILKGIGTIAFIALAILEILGINILPRDLFEQPASVIENDTPNNSTFKTEVKMKYDIKIKDWYITDDNQEEPILVVYYDFTNNSGDAAAFSFTTSDGVFQNGVERGKNLYVSFAHDEIDTERSLDKVQPGYTHEVPVVYSLVDRYTPVDIIIKSIFGDEIYFEETLNITNNQGNGINDTQVVENTNTTMSTLQYINARYGFSISYPKKWGDSIESANGDGANLYGNKGVDVRVYAEHMMEDDFGEYLANHYGGWDIWETAISGGNQSVELTYEDDEIVEIVFVAEKDGVVYTYNISSYKQLLSEELVNMAYDLAKTFKVH